MTLATTLNVERPSTLTTEGDPTSITDPTAATPTTTTITDTAVADTLLEVTVKTTADVAASTTSIITTTTTTIGITVVVTMLTVTTMVRIITVIASGLITTIRRMRERRAPVTTVVRGRVVPLHEGGNTALNPGAEVGKRREDLGLNLEIEIGLAVGDLIREVRMLRVKLRPVKRLILGMER